MFVQYQCIHILLESIPSIPFQAGNEPEDQAIYMYIASSLFLIIKALIYLHNLLYSSPFLSFLYSFQKMELVEVL